MTPTKLLLSQILIVFAIVLAALWASTQWIAAQLAYQPQPGAPWAIAFGLRLYRPWALFAWWYHFDAYAPHVFNKAGLLAGASGFMGCAAAIAGSLWRSRQAQHVTTYGSARWAHSGEIERAGLRNVAGVFSGNMMVVISVTMAPNTSWRSRRPAPAKASDWWSRPCSAGQARRPSTTSRARTGS